MPSLVPGIHDSLIAIAQGLIRSVFGAFRVRFPILDSAKGQTLRCRASLGRPAPKAVSQRSSSDMAGAVEKPGRGQSDRETETIKRRLHDLEDKVRDARARHDPASSQAQDRGSAMGEALKLATEMR